MRSKLPSVRGAMQVSYWRHVPARRMIWYGNEATWNLRACRTGNGPNDCDIASNLYRHHSYVFFNLVAVEVKVKRAAERDAHMPLQSAARGAGSTSFDAAVARSTSAASVFKCAACFANSSR